MTRVAIFGDSIAWGSWDPEGGGWATRLKHEYMQRSANQNEPDSYTGVYLCATPGHRAVDVAARLDVDVNAIHPDWIVMAIGTNDAPNTPLTDFEHTYELLIQRSKSFTNNVVALTTPNVIGEPSGYSNAGLQNINAVIQRVCNDKSVPVVDVHGIFEESDMTGDGLHPNAHGHERMFQHVLAGFTELGLK